MTFQMKDKWNIPVTAVADDFIDHYMAAANGEYVKVYLYILRHRGEELSQEMIADALNHTESDVRRALAYWEKSGVLSREECPAGGGDMTPAQGNSGFTLPAAVGAAAGTVPAYSEGRSAGPDGFVEHGAAAGASGYGSAAGAATGSTDHGAEAGSEGRRTAAGSVGYGVGAGAVGYGAGAGATGYEAAADSAGHGSAIGSAGHRAAGHGAAGHGAAADSTGNGSAVGPASHGEAARAAGHGSSADSAVYTTATGSAGYGSSADTAGYTTEIGSVGHRPSADSAGHGSGIGAAGHGSPASSAGHSSYAPADITVPAAAKGSNQQKARTAAPERESAAALEPGPVYSAEQVNRLSGDEEFAQLLYIAQKYMNKVFTPRDCQVFAYLYDGLKFSPELLEYLVEYCVQNGHVSIRYMETVALNWHKQGFKTPEEAKEYTAAFNSEAFSVMKAFGLGDRRPGTSEQKTIRRWFGDYGFDRELVLMACNRTIAAIHNPSFQYADKILSDWKQAGVRTKADVEALDEKRVKSRGQGSGPSDQGQTKYSRAQDGSRRKSNNQFHNFKERDTDYDALVLKQLKERVGQQP